MTRATARRGAAGPARRTVLLNPGPVNVSERVRRALRRPDLCHREPEFTALLAGVQAKLCRAFAPRGYTAAVVTGSGTLAVEAAITSAVSPGRRLLIVNNGVYGARMAEIARVHGILAEEISAPWLEPPSVAAIEAALCRNPDIQVVAVVHHETTVGLLNPLAAIGAVTRRLGRTLLVDAVSALAGETLDLRAAHVGLCVGTANKCIQGFPGASFVLIRNEELRRMRTLPPRSLYLHLPRYCAASGGPAVPFTPAIQVLGAFDEALAELLEETVAGRIARYRAAATRLRAGFADLGLDLLVPSPWRSNSLTTMALPRGVRYQTLHDGLKRRGFVIYEGQGPLRGKIFRVANMGTITRAEIERFLATLAELLRGRRR